MSNLQTDLLWKEKEICGLPYNLNFIAVSFMIQEQSQRLNVLISRVELNMPSSKCR